jgi:hypothetical protein
LALDSLPPMAEAWVEKWVVELIFVTAISLRSYLRLLVRASPRTDFYRTGTITVLSGMKENLGLFRGAACARA